jgi:hypothetical protein
LKWLYITMAFVMFTVRKQSYTTRIWNSKAGVQTGIGHD